MPAGGQQFMKKPGIKSTQVPCLYKVNYPQHGQVGYVVRLKRRGVRIYELFSRRRFGGDDGRRRLTWLALRSRTCSRSPS